MRVLVILGKDAITRNGEDKEKRQARLASLLLIDQVVSRDESTRFSRLHFLNIFLEDCEVKCESRGMASASSGSRSGHSSHNGDSDCNVCITCKAPRPPRSPSPRHSPRCSPSVKTLRSGVGLDSIASIYNGFWFILAIVVRLPGLCPYLTCQVIVS